MFPFLLVGFVASWGVDSSLPEQTLISLVKLCNNLILVIGLLTGGELWADPDGGYALPCRCKFLHHNNQERSWETVLLNNVKGAVFAGESGLTQSRCHYHTFQCPMTLV